MGWSNLFTNVTTLVCKHPKRGLCLQISVVTCANVERLYISGNNDDDDDKDTKSAPSDNVVVTAGY